MNEARNPALQALFDSAEQGFVDEKFTTTVMDGVKARRRRITTGRLAIAALLIALELLLDAPLQDSLGFVTEMLGTRLYPIGHEWLAYVLTPINSIAGLLALFLLGLHYFYRKIVR